MNYLGVSVKEVIARILRNTRLTDSSYVDDMFEWIPEGIDKLKTKYQLELVPIDLEISNHACKLPCGLVGIEAVVYGGMRLREGGAQIAVTRQPSLFNGGLLATPTTGIFQTDTTVTIENRLDPRLTGSDLTLVTEFCNREYYKLQMNYIQTSFECGCITLHYWKRPVDCEGYPLIPDNENYKTALYWYNIAMMIDAGYEHKEGYKADYCMQKFEFYGARAITEIKYPSVDRMEKLRQSFIRLVPPTHFYSDFFTNSEQLQEIRK